MRGRGKKDTIFDSFDYARVIDGYQEEATPLIDVKRIAAESVKPFLQFSFAIQYSNDAFCSRVKMVIAS